MSLELKTYSVVVILALTLLVFIFISACEEKVEDGMLPNSIEYYHDAQHEVSCWVFSSSGYNAGLSCLPDSQVKNAGE